MIRAFRETLNLVDGDLIIPPHHSAMGAIGAVYYARANKLNMNHFQGIAKLEEYLSGTATEFISLPPLKESLAEYRKDVHFPKNGTEKLGVYLGLDIGSLSTNVVLIDENHRVVARRYLPTAGKPLEAIRPVSYTHLRA